MKGEGINQGLGQGRHIIQGQGPWVHSTGGAQITNMNGENPAQILHKLEQLFEMNAQMLSRVIEATKLNQRGESTSSSPSIFISGEKPNHSQSVASSGTFLQPQLITSVPAANPPQKVMFHGQSHSLGNSPPQVHSSSTEGSSNRQSHGHGQGQGEGQGQGQTLVQSQSQGTVGPGPGSGHYSISYSNSSVSTGVTSPPILTGILTKRPTSAGSTRQSMSVTTTSQQPQFQPYVHLNQNPGQDAGSIFDVTSPTGTPPIPPPSSIQRPLSSSTSPNISSGVNMGTSSSNGMISSVSLPSGSGTSHSSGPGGLSTSATYMNINSSNNSNISGSSNSGSVGFPSGSVTGGTGSGTGSGVISPIGITSPLSGPMGFNPGTGQGQGQGMSGAVSGLTSTQGQGDGRGQQGQGQAVSASSGMSSTSLIANNEKDKSSAFGKLFHYINEMKKELESAQKQRREGQLETQRLREKCQQLDDRLEMEQSKSAGLEDRLDRGKSAQRTLRLQVEAQAAQIEALLEALAQSSVETSQQHDSDRDSIRQPDEAAVHTADPFYYP